MSKMRLPDEFIKWQLERRKEGIENLLLGKGSGYEAHLPVMATYGKKGFKLNVAMKGVGLLPHKTLIKEYVSEWTVLTDDCVASGWDKTRKKRLEVLLDFYSSPDIFDKKHLFSIEMYGTKTFKNIKKSKQCALLFTDLGYKEIFSWQVNCKVKLKQFPDDVYKHAVLLHSLFHSKPTYNYPCVYQMKVIGIGDKRP